MSKRIGTLAFLLALGVFATAWLSGAAQAGPASVCGDGVTEGNEQCDDTNTVSGDGCSFPSCLPEVCGDNIVNPDPPSSEACDDGNTAAGDGCAGDCTCEPEVCGDNIVGCTEECDDGNTVGGDGCEADCTITSTAVQTKKQQACINAINKNLSGVTKAQNADNSTCVKNVASGKTAAIGDCYGDDVAGKVGKAQGKTTATDGKKCQPPKGETPTFAYTAPATVNDAGEAQTLEASTAVLGATPSIILKSANKDGAACQAEVMKQLGAIAGKWMAEALKAKKNSLKTADSAAVLATAINTAVANNAKITAAENKANAGIGKKCTDAEVDAEFDCAGATTTNGLTLCVIAVAKEGACNALEAADGLDLTCPSLP